MKTRNGFVSNSSSSSFVWLGARVPEGMECEEMEKKAKEANLEVGYLGGDYGYVVGKKLFVYYDDGFGTHGVQFKSLEELQKIMQDVQTKVNVFTGVKDQFISLIYGTRYG
jgi:hypothetical protein